MKTTTTCSVLSASVACLAARRYTRPVKYRVAHWSPWPSGGPRCSGAMSHAAHRPLCRTV